MINSYVPRHIPQERILVGITLEGMPSVVADLYTHVTSHESAY